MFGTEESKMKKSKFTLIKCITVVGLVVGLNGCKGDNNTSEPEKMIISDSGSDAMVNLAQMWAEPQAPSNNR